MNGSPFVVCSWKNNFLAHLIDHALELTGNDLGRACFVFPHTRPVRYLTDLLKKDLRVSRPLVMPQMYSISDLFSHLAGRIARKSYWKAGNLDRIGLLLQVVRDLSTGKDSSPGEAFPADDARFFYPWGQRLAALFEECLTNGRIPTDLPHMDEQVTPFAARLLGQLSAIFQGYMAGLLERGWTSPGLDTFRVTDHMEREGDSFISDVLRNRSVILAGFHALTGTEERLFKHLWQRHGASIFIHADPALVDGGQHWSCDIFRAWAGQWKTRLTLAERRSDSNDGPAIRFVEGYDLHSQLETMQKELTGSMPEEASEYAAHTAIILPESGLLMPVMHHLPPGEVNISMGYPLSRSPLFRLLDTLLLLQEQRREGGYHWRDFVNLIRHPYVKMLSPQTETETSSRTGLQREMHALEQAARQGTATYLRPATLLEALIKDDRRGDAEPLNPENLVLIRRILKTCLDAFENVLTPAGLAAAFEGVAQILLEFGGDLWERFPIDAECLYRLLQALIPELGRSALSRETLSPITLYALARQIMKSERVPFEASPLVGLQVLGMLEARLLTFRKVIVLEATEDLLPGSAPADPLLPESLRPALGLPELRTREQMVAYTFFRLLAGAEEVLLLWQEGGEARGLEERKKKKSRFIEELLWNYEKKTGKLFAHKESSGPLTVLSCAIAPLPQERRALPKTSQAGLLLDRFLVSPISSTALDDYLQCPARFFQNRILRLGPSEEPDTGEGSHAIGNVLHQVLHSFYIKLMDRDLPAGKEAPPNFAETLKTAFEAHLEAAHIKRNMAADAYAMFNVAGQERLSRYLHNQPPTRILGLEKKLTATFSAFGRSFTLTGNLDRLDLRPEGPVIVDYKTGARLPSVQRGAWQDKAFWKALRDWQPQPKCLTGADPVLLEVGKRFGSIQLPFYILLYRLAYGEDAANALWVQLADNGQEKLLFDKKTDESTLGIVISALIPELVAFLLRHMQSSPCFRSQPGQYCDWCSVQASCMAVASGK